jgi:hypothetical protein
MFVKCIILLFLIAMTILAETLLYAIFSLLGCTYIPQHCTSVLVPHTLHLYVSLSSADAQPVQVM